MPRPINLTTENFLLFSVITFSAAMRLWNIDSWTFTNDELSALNRVNFDSIADLFKHGISIDAHPAGTQFFLFLWTKLFGVTEIAVRLPFVLLSILSTYVIYKVVKEWAHANAGIIAASLFAGLGYTVTYSLLARPYALGTLAFVLVLLFWTQLIKKQLRIPFLSYLGLSVSLALCAYTHYFAAITAAFVFLLGLLFIHKTQLKAYMFTGLFALLLFLPHLWIFLHQFSHSNGGTSWLGLPETGALLNFLNYAFNESWILILTLICFFLVKIIAFRNTKITWLTIIGSSIFAFTVSFAIIYSHCVAPIFQYSVLSFGFIGLILAISDLTYFPEIKAHAYQTYLLFVILALTTFVTNDYRIESRFGTFEKIALSIKAWEKESDQIVHITSINHANYLNYYLDKHGTSADVMNLKLKFDNSGKLDMKNLASLVATHDGNYFSYSKSTLPCRNEAKQLIKTRFPRELDGFEGENCESTLFGKGEDNKAYLYRSELKVTRTADSTYMCHNMFRWKDLKVVEDPENCLLAVVGQSKLYELNNVVIVAEIKRDGKPLKINDQAFWTGSSMVDYILEKESWGYCLSVIELPEELRGNDEIHIYIYNPKNTEIELRDYEVKLFEK